MIKKKLKDLNLMDDFLMNRVVSDPECGKAFAAFMLRTIFGREMGNLMVVPQKVEYGEDTDKHGIRMDVYMDEEDAAIYDMEVDQSAYPPERESLPKRVRFYHSKIDAGMLSSGRAYAKLRDVCVIFIMNYDPFGLNRVVYTVKNSCVEEPEMPYEDGTSTIFLYTRGTEGNPSGELVQMLRYLEDTSAEGAKNTQLQEIDKMVQKVKRKEETGVAYMQLYEYVQREAWAMAKEAAKETAKEAAREAAKEAEEKGRVKGRAEGREEGRKEGRVEGKAERRAEDILLFLEEKDNVPSKLKERITSEKDEETLRQWLKAAAQSDSIESFRKKALL